MSHINVTCPNCETTGRARKRYAGFNVACRQCAYAFRMPPAGDCVGMILGEADGKHIVKVKTKSITRLRTGKVQALLQETQKLILLRERGIISSEEYDNLRAY